MRNHCWLHTAKDTLQVADCALSEKRGELASRASRASVKVLSHGKIRCTIMATLPQYSNQDGAFDELQRESLCCESSEMEDKKYKKLKKKHNKLLGKHKKLKKAFERQSAELQRLREQADSKKLFWKTLSISAPKAIQFCGDIYNAKHREKMLDKQLSFEMYNKKHKKKHKKSLF